MQDIPEFIDREADIKRMKAVLSGRPNLLYFVYGPINSGKTALLMKILEELPEEYRIFYISFRRVETRRYEDFIEAMFDVKEESLWEKMKDRADILASGLKFAEQVVSKFNYSIILPSEIIDRLKGINGNRKDCFKYLEELMRRLNKGGKRPIIVLDELQMLKEIKKNGPILHDLFNFLVGMTKETHLCHCLCSTSDCLFIEDIYSNARLEGRAEYILVDDLDKDDAYKFYEEFGFEDKELVWDWIDGKVGDMIRLYEKRKQGYNEEEGLKNMLKDEVGRLRWVLDLVEEGEKEGPEVEKIAELLKRFIDGEDRRYQEVKGKVLKFLIEENVLFYNPVEGIVRPQSRLLWRAIREVIEN